MSTQTWLVDPLIDGVVGPFMHITYDDDGRILTVTQQYIP